MSNLFLGADGNLVVMCSKEERYHVKAIGGKWMGGPTWSVPMTSEKVAFLKQHLPEIKVDPAVEYALEQRIAKEKRLAEIRALAKTDTPIQLKVPGVKLSLFNYQKLGVLFALTNDDGVLIGDSMGLGKTIQAIGVSCHKKYNSAATSCLVITPASLKFNWPLEIEKFTNEKYVVIDGKTEDRIMQWMGVLKSVRGSDGKLKYERVKDGEKVFFYVVNFELVLEDLFGGKDIRFNPDDDEAKIARKLKTKEKAERRAELLEPVRTKVFDIIIVDECHALKSSKSKRSQNLRKLKGRFRIALSGTPMDGRLEELHSIMEFVKPGLFPSKSMFLQRHAEFDFHGAIVKYKNIEEVRERIAPYFIRRLKKDVLKELPDKTYENKLITLTPQEMKTYRDIADRAHELTEDAAIMTAIIRCKQFCDHPELLGMDMNSSKMAVFLSVIDELVVQNGQKVIVFSQYAKMNEIIIREMERLRLKYLYMWGETPKEERANMQKQFNEDSSIDMIIGTDAMAFGLNLTGASYVIQYDDFWSPSVMEQREDRAHRHGQKNAVTVVNFICQNTIEERIRDVLYSKSSMSAQTLGDDTEEAVLRRLNPKDVLKLL